MNFNKPFKVACCFALSLLMTNIPAMALADGVMISTSTVVNQMNRAQTEAKVRDIIQREDVQKALKEQGVSPDEINARLASLSESELRNLSHQVEYARAGGDILVTILVVVLIIFLIKRI